MTHNNPFKYGELVGHQTFCNRQKELKRIQQGFSDGQNIVLISPRRWGKSSLVAEAVSRYRGKYLLVSLDCFGLRSSDQFFEAYLQAILKASSTKMQHAADTLKKYVSSLIPFISFSAGEKDEIKISINLQKRKPDVSLLDLPQKIARERKVKFIICIDEFQKIRDWDDSKEILELLRSHWQKHHDVCYCLYGSKRHLMTALFADSSQPFYRFGETIFLTKIEKHAWAAFIQKHFEATGKKITPELCERITDLAQSHSYYVQYISRLCWANTHKVASANILEQSWMEFLNDHNSLFLKTTEKLTRFQVNYLKAVIAGERQFTSQRVSKEYDLGSPGNIKRIEKALEDNEIMDFLNGPELCEPYFGPLFKKTFY
ncbi:MAG: ATP-binding protein [Cyclobacteriaceae bacterium]